MITITRSDKFTRSDSRVPTAGAADVVVVHRIHLSDLGEALRLGWEDFKAVPTHSAMLCVIYPILGLVLARMVLGYSSTLR